MYITAIMYNHNILVQSTTSSDQLHFYNKTFYIICFFMKR